MKEPKTDLAKRIKKCRERKLEGLSEIEIQAHKKLESQKRAERRLRAKLKQAPDEIRQNIGDSVEYQNGSFKHRKTLTTLTTKDDKNGLKDKLLKKTLDDY